MTDNVSKIKDRLNIVDVVSSYIKLNKAGANLKAPCPFHNEKTPSFFVSPDRGTYKCFGCGAGGDIFTFVEQFEGVDFPGAMRVLAEKAGVELVKEDPRLKNERERLYKVMEETTLFFENRLASNIKAKKYLEGRGLTEETIKKFRLGFVEDGWRNLSDHLKQKGYSEDELEKVGLIKKTERGLYDRFRNRIIFPIFDNSGRVVAFSGRLYEDDGKSAKYLNSPETVLFSKSKILYGYNFAKSDIRKRDFSILVEGQMDIIMSHQAGFTNTVATSGTALTGEHLSLLKRLSDKIVMAFDGDSAGLMATNKGAKLALGMEMEVKLVEIPEGSDPADVILKDKNAWIEALKNTVHIIDFNLNILLKEGDNGRKLGIGVRKILLPLVSELKSNIERDYFISSISEKTNISEKALWDDLEKVGLEDRSNEVGDSVVTTDKKEASLKQLALREISGILYWQEAMKDPLINVDKQKERLSDVVGEELFDKIENLPESIKNEVIFEAENLYTDDDNLTKKINELFLNLEKYILIEKRNEIQNKIDKEKDESEKIKLSDKLLELSKKIDSKN